ncbi:MAG: DNA-binding protein [Candidatus Edwardsbacteria bacterium]|nr:DNA-binding protein [Candidatus Edwardsbacteria bacterium]
MKNGWLAAHNPSDREINDLLAAAERDLADCRAASLSPDWRAGIAYNAALQSAAAALAAAGYRAGRDQHHMRVIQSLAHTIGTDADTIALLDRFRKKRNTAVYERAGLTSDKEAEEIRKLSQRLYSEVRQWLKKNHPKLMK